MSKVARTSIVSSKVPSNSLVYRVLIDKIDYNPLSLFSIDHLREHAYSRGLVLKREKTKDNKLCLRCGEFRFLSNEYQNNIYKILSNPEKFNSFDIYLDELRLIVPPNIYSSMAISQLDLAMDIFNQCFKWIDQRLMVKNKQSFQRVIENDFIEATRVYGKKPSFVKFYNKKKLLEEKGLELHHSYDYQNRIESSYFTKKALPTQKVDDLKKELLNPNFNPFKNIVLIDYTLIDPLNGNLPKNLYEFNKVKKFHTLKTIIEVNGVYYAKKHLAQYENFSRDYSEMFRFNCEHRLSERYTKGINAYFTGSSYLIYHGKVPKKKPVHSCNQARVLRTLS